MGLLSVTAYRRHYNILQRNRPRWRILIDSERLQDQDGRGYGTLLNPISEEFGRYYA